MIIVSLSMLIWIIFTTMASIQMEQWCEDPLEHNYYLYIYMGLSIASNIFIFIRAYTLVLSGARQGQKVHKKMIKSLLYASLNKFYNRIPVGRIISRLTKDLRELDESIGYAIGTLLANLFQLFGTLVICLYASSLFVLIPVLFVTFCCVKVKSYYMKTQR